MTDPQTKRQRHIGSFASEEDAAREYDCAAVEVRGQSAKLNFPGEAVSEVPAKKKGRLNGSEEEQDGSEEERKQQQQRLDWLEEWKEIEQIVMAELVAILGLEVEKAEKAIMRA
jgi:hypothetical protein